MPELMVQIDGQSTPVRLADCFWVLTDGQGCASGSMVGHSAATEEAARRDFTPRSRDRDRQIRQGWRVRLLSKEQWRQDAQPCFLSECSHRKVAAIRGNRNA
ncbi:hypothetical protein [Streptomyces sp. NPDC024089]|uniref:hypothetical protein n=1 Tax=Streptomyces sp. NPDC024089 TaxID=3154328 RepID=UPI00340A74BF